MAFVNNYKLEQSKTILECTGNTANQTWNVHSNGILKRLMAKHSTKCIEKPENRERKKGLCNSHDVLSSTDEETNEPDSSEKNERRKDALQGLD